MAASWITVHLSGAIDPSYNAKVNELTPNLKTRFINVKYIESVQPYKVKGKVITKICLTSKHYLVDESVDQVKSMIKKSYT